MGRGSPGTQAIPVYFAFIAMGTELNGPPQQDLKR